MINRQPICKHSKYVIERLQEDHLFNITAIEKKAGLRKLKLHEFINGKTKLDSSEALKIKQLLKNSTKLQK